MKRSFSRISQADGGYVEIDEGPDDIIITKVDPPKDLITTRVEPPKDVIITRVEPAKDVFIDESDDDYDTDDEESHMTIHHNSKLPCANNVALTKENISTTCPYTRRRMSEPVRNKHCGHTYDKGPIEQYINSTGYPRCPISGCPNEKVLCSSDLEDNKELRLHIEQSSLGAKRRRLSYQNLYD